MNKNSSKNNGKKVEGDSIYAQNIVNTIREPLLVLDNKLRVVSANKSFYDNFRVNKNETEGRIIFDLGNRQWNIPELRKLLENILPENNSFSDYKIEHNFENIGTKSMLINGRRLDSMQMVLLSIEDITGREKTKELEKMNKLMVARELKMIELKEEIKKLEAKLKNKQK